MRLGFRLPKSLRHWYLWAGKYTPFQYYEDEVRTPRELLLYENHLVFMREREGCYTYGIPRESIAEPDPIFFWNQGEGWEPTCLYDDLGCRVLDWLTDKVFDDAINLATPVTLTRALRRPSPRGELVARLVLRGVDRAGLTPGAELVTPLGEDVAPCSGASSTVASGQALSMARTLNFLEPWGTATVTLSPGL